MKTALCFLVINRVKELPELAIKSAMSQTDAPIFVGYIQDEDISGLPVDEQIKYVKIQSDELTDTAEYQDFGSVNFYRAVIKKWLLFQQIMKLGFDCIIYSDVDLVWVRDATKEIEKYFENQDAEIVVQSITQSPAHPALCMGFFAFRSSNFTTNFISKCSARHQEYFNRKEFIGDDEIVTEMYIESGFDSRIRELPQNTFPVGYSINLFHGRSKMPGIARVDPFIFHANYVIGVRKKRILIRKFLGRTRLRNLGFRPDYVLFGTHIWDKVFDAIKGVVRACKSNSLTESAKSLEENK